MKFEHEVAVGVVLIGATAIGPHLLSPSGTSLGTRVAAIGGLWALIGVVAIARPVWRIGALNWLKQSVFSTLGPEFRDKRLDDPLERSQDEAMQNVFGPILVGVGTLLGGFSGYFG